MKWHDIAVKFVFELSILLVPVIAGFLIALLKAWTQKLLADLEATKPQFAHYLYTGAQMAVEAAEQAGVAGFVDDRKQYALNILQKYLDTHGFEEFDIDLLEAAIESEVLRVNRQ